jgi:predicted DsbA family dithiol-disulfide isomerase
MPVTVRHYSDPACPWSWGTEPTVRRLIWEFGDQLEFVWVMGGLARSYGEEYADFQCGIAPGGDCFSSLISLWLDVAAETQMPHDPRIWTESPLSGTYPACQAVKAASEQGWEAGYRYLRRLREGIMYGRRKLDHLSALLAEAGPAGLDRERFEVDIRSNAITEAFAADLEEVRDPPPEAREADAVGSTEGKERVSFPSAVFVGEDGARRGVWGPEPYEVYREAAVAAGAPPGGGEPPQPLAVVKRFGPVATREIEEICRRPRPAVEAELWELAREWKLKPIGALTGTLWELT